VAGQRVAVVGRGAAYESPFIFRVQGTWLPIFILNCSIEAEGTVIRTNCIYGLASVTIQVGTWYPPNYLRYQ